MVLNLKKCRYLCIAKSTEQESFTFECLCPINIKKWKHEAYLLKIHSILIIMQKNCTKAAQDLSGLSKRDGYLNKDKVNIL